MPNGLIQVHIHFTNWAWKGGHIMVNIEGVDKVIHFISPGKLALAPFLSRSLAEARPIPWAAPVISATLPDNIVS